MVKRLFISCVLLLMIAAGAFSQKITGVVIDAATGDSIAMAGVVYRTHHVMTAADYNGRFSIARHNGWKLYFTAMGYKTKEILVNEKTKNHIVVKLKPDTKQLEEVVVKSKKNRYSRKNNPAVELMKRVIAAKKKTDLDNNDYYEFYKYQKLTLAKNNVSPEDIQEQKEKGNKDWLVDQIEVCPMNGNLICPVQISETVSRKVYRKSPRAEKTTVLGESSIGVANLVETAGNILDASMKDIFTDVDIYDDQVRLLQFPFTSPIGKDAIGFYRYYIVDTCYIDKDQCIQLTFVPNNQQDFGFRGDIWVLNDSTLHVRKVSLTIPKKSDVNFVDNMKIEQEYVKLPDGQWVLDTDNMLVELKLNRMLNNAVVIRTTKLSDYKFTELAKREFRGTATHVVDQDARNRGADFWNQFRTVKLTKSEQSVGGFAKSVASLPGMKTVLFLLKAFMNNYVECTLSDSIPSKFDIGPVNTIINKNIVDGWRFRLSGRTTAALNNHLFWNGYLAYGAESAKWYYSTLFTWSLNKKNREPWEFPIRQFTFLSEYDIMSPSDKFLLTNKDNMFMAFKTREIDKLYFYNRQQIEFKYETLAGFATTIGLKTEGIRGAAEMEFRALDGTPFDKEIRTTEAHLGFRFAPGETFINTKQRRYPINLDAPIFAIDHTVAVDGVLGGKYKMNFTEASIYKRFWLNSWGKLDIYVAGGAQWNTVPFPLLIMPRVNLGWMSQPGTYTFQLMNNMEFLNDRYAMWHVSWDLNGKLFNRVPLLKKLKWREFISFRGMYGKLTNKNNPYLPENAGSDILLQFPAGCNIMSSKPYAEVCVGVHNIFKFLEVDYVHRLSYNDLDTAIKNGVRFAINMTF
ncbi:MAG: carboxypeptidase-like regulatory domain-containing protein [Prevotella sp.]|nr:carboxypeptidase-like regulatory domain-containing protein [Prevotella sp.]